MRKEGLIWNRAALNLLVICGGVLPLFLFAVFASAPADARESSLLRIEIPPVIEAREGGFFLGEYADIEGDARLADSASMVWIEPSDGRFDMGAVVEALGLSDVAGKPITLSMPETVKVVMESRVASELRAMTAWKWRIDVERIADGDLDEYANYSLPPKVQPGARSVALKLTGDDGRRVKRQVKLRWFQPVVYSVNAIQRGSEADLADLRMRIDEIGMIGTYVWLPEQIAGAELRQSIGVGRPITAGDVNRPDLVKPGSSVTLMARVNGLGIEAHGIAMQRGGIGDVIKVKNLSSKKILSGKIIDAGLVLISR
ncbi:MAG: flagellar basal body P-ring formation chaperone FlgA [Synergistaceae bacterium]|jgi:flagella basal body P-ring formation protein FlgA|nr:flagellar basal body P-ring formation chaperone FlgA [Synergistaceae bacterium]